MNSQRLSDTGEKRIGRFHYGFIIVACCCLMMGVNIGITFSCAGIFYKPVSSSLGVSVGEFGLYMSIMYIASTLVLPIGGKLIDHYSARWLLTGSSAVMGLTFIGMGFSNQLWHIYLAGAILGATVAFLLYLSFPTLINRWFRVKVGLLMGICSAASGVGGMLFNPIGAAVITGYGWNMAYIGFGLLVLLIDTPVLALLLRDRPADMGLKPYGMVESATPDAKSGGEPGIMFAKAVRMPAFYGVLLFSFLIMAMSTLNLFIPNYVTSLSFTLEQGAYAASAAMAGVMIGKLALGHINDRSCIAGVLVTTLAGISGLVMMLGGALGLAMIISGAFLFGWAYAGVTVQTTMLTRSVFGIADYARIYAYMSMAQAAGGAIASGGWGLLVDATSYPFIFLCGVGMLAVCTVIGVAAVRRRVATNI